MTFFFIGKEEIPLSSHCPNPLSHIVKFNINNVYLYILQNIEFAALAAF